MRLVGAVALLLVTEVTVVNLLVKISSPRAQGKMEALMGRTSLVVRRDGSILTSKVQIKSLVEYAWPKNSPINFRGS